MTTRTATRAARAFVTVWLVVSSASAHGAVGRNFLWKATGRQGVVYLVGSIHALPADSYPLSPAFDAAFKDADLLVEEIDLGDSQGQLQLLTRGMLPAGQSLDRVLSPGTLALMNKFTANLGVAAEPLKLFKPWMIVVVLEGLQVMQAGFDPELGVDKHFYDEAQRQGKAVQGLETAEYQISRFDEMTMDQQDRMLADTLKTLETEKASFGKLADAWKAGDTQTVERVVLSDLKQDPVIYQRLLVERNRNWLPKVEALFNRRGHAFVVVGAAHLLGPDGLIAMLKAKGYSVEQM
jgi:hypothetical protein